MRKGDMYKNLRKVIKITKGKPITDGAGVKLVRVLADNEVKDYNPFLMLDALEKPFLIPIRAQIIPKT